MPKHASEAPDPAVIEMRKALARKFVPHARSEGENATAVDDLDLFRHTAPSACHPAMVEPSLSVFVQGRKLINLGELDSRPVATTGNLAVATLNERSPTRIRF